MNAHAPKRLFAPERWSQVRRLVNELDRLEPAARSDELQRIADADAELARAVRSLLDATLHSVAEPLQSAVDRLAGGSTETVPARVGPFRPLRRIGSGGMGVVYLAEREGTDFTQRVALKLLEGNAARMARFAARERRILSALTHPNITAFVDAGNDESGTWLAMEYVDGEPLLEYCHTRRLDAAARVGVFEQVCAAVAHAHAQLVVHRDLKPSNVLVSNEGAAKLLDFGIAQIIDASEERAPATRVFTPEYAAPEQLRGDHTTTATDVYSLGLMLYELIAGKRLPTLERRGDDDWTTADLARLATTAPDPLGDAPTLIGADARSLVRQLRGDLGRIITHAVATVPAQRYASVALLREDLTRWREHRPLTIARPNLAYVMTRFMRRHRLAVFGAATALTALVALSGIALWQAGRAQQMAQRADRARSFLADMFANTDPFAAKHVGKNPVDLLRDGAERLEREFGDSPEMQADLRETIASVLDRLGEPKQARDLMERSVAQLREIHGVQGLPVGAALEQLATAREDSGDLDGAHAAFTESYQILLRGGAEFAHSRISSVTGLAKLANLRGDYADAERMHQAVLAERTASEGPESPDIAMDLMNLAADSLYAERYPQAEQLAQRSRAMLERTLGPRHARNIYVDNVLGLAQASTASYKESIATLRGAGDLARAVLQPGAMMIGNVIGSLGSAQMLGGDAEAAVATLADARRLNDAAKNPRRGQTAMMLGVAQLRTGRNAEALTTLREARETMAAQKTSDVAFALWGQAAYGAALAASGDAEAGEREARAAREAMLASARPKSVRLGEIDTLLADLIAAKSPVDAHALRVEAQALFAQVYGADHPRTRTVVAQLANATGH